MTLAVHKCILFPAALALFLSCAAPLCAQQDSQSSDEGNPKPAGSSLPVPVINSGDQQDQTDQTNMTPDTTPLTGLLAPTLGAPEVRHSYWMPGIQVSSAIQSSSYNQTQNSGWVVNNFLIGNLSLLKVWGRSELAVNYSGGGFLSSDSTQGNGSYQQLALVQTLQGNRWQLQLVDQFSYLPLTSIGFGGGSGLGIPGTGGSLGPVIPGLGNNYIPNQSIYAAEGPRYSNASVIQTTYAISPRASVTFSGSYALLNFVNAGNVDNQTISGSAGYNYSLTQQDSIGVFYLFSAYHFSGEPQAYGNHSVNLTYGRKLTGRLALRLFAGPSFTTARVSTNGNSLSHGVNVGANLAVSLRNGGFNIGYSHGLTGGSGVLTGSTADQLNFGANRALGRIWTGQINVSYAHNTPVQGFSPSVGQSYNTYTFGGGVNRPLGRNATLAIAYNTILTDYGSAGCSGQACSSNQTYNYVTINFQWHTRPFILP